MIPARDATKLAQAILRQVEPALQLDGWWGNYTDTVYKKAPANLQSAVREALRTSGTSPEQLLTASRVVASSAKALGDGWLAEDYADSLMDRVAGEFALSPALLRTFLRLEAATMIRDGKKFYNTNSVSPNGLFRGLLQMGKPAWADVQNALPGFPGYDRVFDPYTNARAGAKYVQLNMRYAQAKGYKGDFTGEVLYALHNQGAAGFMRLLREKKFNENTSNQSADAQRMIRVALRQNGVTVA